jgi:hypothetical protein
MSVAAQRNAAGRPDYNPIAGFYRKHWCAHHPAGLLSYSSVPVRCVAECSDLSTDRRRNSLAPQSETIFRARSQS